jgi:two-component system response regulator RegA
MGSTLDAGDEDSLGKVLVVDDDAAVRNALTREFRHRGYDVQAASCVDEALASARVSMPDLAVVDLRLDRESGLEVLQRLRRQQPDLAVVMLTGFGTIPLAVEAVRMGATDFLTKPVAAEQILEAVQHKSRGGPLRSLARIEWDHIHSTLEACDGNVSEAARCLRMHRRSLQRKLRKRPPG